MLCEDSEYICYYHKVGIFRTPFFPKLIHEVDKTFMVKFKTIFSEACACSFGCDILEAKELHLLIILDNDKP
jgi:hypothetical protein